MGDIAIQVEGLSKQFRIGKQQQSRTFREVLNDAAAAPFKRIGGLLRGNAAAAANLTETIWALKDVSFEVKKGEVVGIIGRNGAGKSTLLKILSQITEPTEGCVKLYGRVGALLEVGTGFHTELTGRENIYLNGAILGMSREEIRRKFDEMVAFAEIEKFIDTPVKHYSSGMGLRLGFAVAAHLEPEILVVDEVLAVGDAAFQKKCLGKMGEVAGDGRTVLFVSHNLTAVTSLCKYGIWLENGRLAGSGKVSDIMHQYLKSMSTSLAVGVIQLRALNALPLYVTEVKTINMEGKTENTFLRHETLTVQICGEIMISSDQYVIALDIKGYDDTLLFRTHDIESWNGRSHLPASGPFQLRCTLPANLFPAGIYKVGLITAIVGRRELQKIYPVLQFEIVQEQPLTGVFFGTRGILTPYCLWELNELCPQANHAT